MSVARSPLLVGQAGLSTGHTVAELRTALRTGAKRLLFGTHTGELSRLLPPEHGIEEVLTIAAEGRLLHDTEVFRLIAAAIHQRTHLLPEDAPKLEIIITELLSNAIEHGNLGLSTTRKDQVDDHNWFETYLSTVNNTLQTALGRIPILLTCTRTGNEVIVTIEDRGMGFNVQKALANAPANPSPTGRGLPLLHAWLGSRLHYRNNGRTASFSLPVQAQPGSRLPTRATVRNNGTVLVVDNQQLICTMLQNALNQSGFRHVNVLPDHANLPSVAAQMRPQLIILAIHMPDPDGFKLFSQLKSNPATAAIPVMFMCPAENAQDKNRAFQLGAADVITSPVDPAELSSRVSSHLYQSQMLTELKTLTSRLEGELERAKIFQHDLFPTATELTSLAHTYNLTLASHYQGCETLAGDYWTVIPLDATRFAFAVADFTGHGTVAALNTVQLHTLLRHETNLTNPALTSASLNAQLSRLLGKGSFATFVYGVVDTAHQTLTYTGCGAPNLLLRHQDGSVDVLDCAGLPLGLAPDIAIMPRQHKLPQGSVLLAYSDALTDTVHAPTKPNAKTPELTAWGQDKLVHTLKTWQTSTPLNAQTLMDKLLETFHQTARLPLKDDLTLLAFSLTPPQEK